MSASRAEPLVLRRRGWTAGVVPLGIAVTLLGAWALFVPLVGPYFGYGFDTHTTWLASSRQGELDIGPGILAYLGGLGLLIPSRSRAALAGLLAVVAGVWLLLGASLYPLWGTELAPFGSTQLRALKWIGYFYGTGALITCLAVFAEGMLSRTSYVEERSGYLPLVSAPPISDTPVQEERGSGEPPVS